MTQTTHNRSAPALVNPSLWFDTWKNPFSITCLGGPAAGIGSRLRTHLSLAAAKMRVPTTAINAENPKAAIQLLALQRSMYLKVSPAQLWQRK